MTEIIARTGLPARKSPADISDIIAMAWQDDTPFEALALQFGLSEPDVIALMRKHLKARSFRLWRTRVRGRVSKHLALHTQRQQRDHSIRVGSVSAAMHNLRQQISENFPLPSTSITRQSLR